MMTEMMPQMMPISNSQLPREIYIVSACRTPIGSFMGQFQKVSAVELGSIVIKESIKRGYLTSDDIDQVIMGQTLTAGQGQNPARQAAMLADLPTIVPAFTVNMLCGSGLKAVYLAWQMLMIGDAKVIVAGGQENMSRAQHSTYIRGGARYGSMQLTDTLQFDGLTDAFHNVSMGLTAEHLAEKYKIGRLEQDQYALDSQMKTKRAIESDKFVTEIVPVLDKKKSVEIVRDEFPKLDITLEKLTRLRPSFKDSGTVTSGNASGINDGAAAVVLVNAEGLMEKGLKPMAVIKGFAEAGIEPLEMGLGPVNAVQKLMDKLGWIAEEVDLFEINEAFAVQSVLCAQMLNIDESKLNVNGGALALGHPIGASGARCLVTLLHNLKKIRKTRGIAALCVGGGMGIAIAVENVLD